jgi:hypothetical protein
MFNWAVRKHMVSGNPALAADPPQVKSRQLDVPSMTEVRAVQDVATPEFATHTASLLMPWRSRDDSYSGFLSPCRHDSMALRSTSILPGSIGATRAMHCIRTPLLV